ncbi:major facilitator superfamily domain-containing protein [Yarrowia lipolytica]|jgi:multidrug resistance protein|uniref:YALI0A18920p n=2 Tax=Yarrowia lipolytica TaxID=4952 RepID=Q6CGJ0_YARLI|nr:YALI0A18920p [Yarrowia lipolytica CLIB122]RDW28084.1 major facilitator superfamily domain-containing protein [Yarrowia lipolytica]RDW32058.1 major facilitator superfamily domain-containing protein [Yarrowia lipolytica]RDW39926.1 major facilitator superfamily domain-containing protein [Yarrowia lipolytica]RDW48382.1 major facilitator superfamily domain-containing protein [Yarrowia lipolytica]RDW54803.1 major facilitator superfamily domain-containing protein [Yarrowia lipolytica]|eukprot:XP_500222.1 YALI0A18920p [Yarrowia lipolytica CLIB122]
MDTPTTSHHEVVSTTASSFEHSTANSSPEVNVAEIKTPPTVSDGPRSLSDTQDGDRRPEVIMVTLEPDDPENISTQLSLAHKWLLAGIVCATFLQITANSSAFGNATGPIMKELHCGKVVASLGISLFILGLGSGPMLFAPLSEYYGRRPIYIAGLFLYVIFQLPVCLAPNIQTMLVGRFLSAFFSSSFAAVSGGTITDIFDKKTEGDMLVLAMSTFSISPFFGPVIGPLISGFIVQNTKWRWAFWVMMIWSGVLFAIVILFSKETYAPVLTERKVRRLRGEREKNLKDHLVSVFSSDPEKNPSAPVTINEKTPVYYTCALMETKKTQSLGKSVMTNCQRPFGLLSRDPMVLLVCVYSGFLLAIVYGFFVVFPLVFGNIYNFQLQFKGMSFLPLGVGQLTATYGSIPLMRYLTKRFNDKEIAKGKPGGAPELKLIPMMIGCFLCPIGLFWFGWTCYPSIHWIVPMIGSGFFGAGIVLVFAGTFGFLVDGYRVYAASAMAANAFVRSAMACAFPLFARQMFDNWSYHWATSLLGFVSCIMIPIPFVFYIHGEKLRAKSPYAWT